VLPTDTYLALVSKTFIILTDYGFLNQTYPELFYLKKIIQPGDTVIDIGANLGYYATKMAALVGPTGAVYMVEPVPQFQKTLLKNTKNYHKTCVLIPYALGDNEQMIAFETPLSSGNQHHGTTKVAEQNKGDIEVQMKKADDVFGAITTKIKFVKCDVEGHENKLLPAMIATIQAHRPMMQVEVEANNRAFLYDWYQGLDYCVMLLKNGALAPITKNEMLESDKQDFYFLPN
jgi:FkbM family methyltransferase